MGDAGPPDARHRRACHPNRLNPCGFRTAHPRPSVGTSFAHYSVDLLIQVITTGGRKRGSDCIGGNGTASARRGEPLPELAGAPAYPGPRALTRADTARA